jgi:flagellar hook-length control protein FliK
MQINNLGFAGLLGAGSANTAAAASGNSLGQAFGLLLGAPNTPAGAGITPPLAANDGATPGAATPNLSMAQLLTTAAPLTAPASPAMPEAPAIAAPDAKPVVTDINTGELPLPTEEAILVAPQPPAKPAVPAKPNQPGKPAEGSKPEAGLDLLADAAPQPPVAEAPAETAETPAPVKRGPRIAKDAAEELPAAPSADAQPVAAEIVQLAAVQAPVRPELAAKPQPSPTRQIGEVAGGARKADAVRTEPAAAQPVASSDKSDAAVSAIAGKAGDAGDNARGDDRGQAPAFTLRQDAHATPTHAATETSRVQASAAPATAEPVLAARPGYLGQQMGVEIARKVEAGEDTLRVRLSPDALGKVEVTLSFDNGGKLHATVRAESAHALDLLRQDMPDLGRALDQAGIRADAGSFRFESRSDGGGAQAQQQNQNSSGGNQLAGNDEPDMTETAYREIRGDGQVDLLA